eukprot:841970-Amphidinium_carterae.1
MTLQVTSLQYMTLSAGGSVQLCVWRSACAGDADAQAGAEANETLLLLGVASLLNHGEMNKAQLPYKCRHNK